MTFPPQFEAPSPEELHDLLPAYDVLAFIAKGGMGAVYKAHQKSLERDVAIKILPREFGADQEFRRRFEDEAKAMAKLNHPNLIGVYDFGEVDGMPYIVMEFVDGKSLHHSAHGKAIEQKEVARLVNGICDGLAHAHDAGILHRDIKPANILLDSKKRPKIGDFGLARAADSTEGEGVIYGTPHYTAPEIMKNPDAVDTRSDVFSTGVILYELLTGKLPEANYMPASQVEEVDPRFDKIVRRATHPSPTLRYADAGAMAKDVKALRDALEKQIASIVTKAPAPAVPPPAAPAAQAMPAEAAAAEAPPAPAVPQVTIATGPNWSLLRNLVIILLLSGAIYGMYRAYQWKKADVVRQKEEQDRVTQQEKQAKAAEMLALQKQKEREARKRAEVVRPVNIPKEEEPEKPLEALARLKPLLAAGEREEFPETTQVRGASHFFFVETPLSWQRASAFAEAHGGHLATCLNTGEQNWLTSKIPKGTTIWIGGGATSRTAWGWVDGTEWTVRKPSTATGNSATLSDLGSIRAKPGGEKYPFFIQWRDNGTNPGSLQEQLERMKATLSSPEPVFPPGVLTFESRQYLIIEKNVSWDEAASIASSAHGHLAVPSSVNESAFLRKSVSSILDEGTGAWIGGLHNDRAWAWATGEPWAFAEWAPNSPDGDKTVDTAVRLLSGPKGGWDDADPNDPEAAAAFVIEWSKDRSSSPVAVAPGVGSDWAGLRADAEKKVRALEAQHAKAIAENGKNFKVDLDFWHRGLRANEERTYAPTVARLKAKVKRDGSIDLDKKTEILLSPRGVQIVHNHLDKEAQLQATFFQEVNKVRLIYIKALQDKMSSATSGGLTSQARAIANEIEACGTDGLSILKHFGLDPSSVSGD